MDPARFARATVAVRPLVRSLASEMPIILEKLEAEVEEEEEEEEEEEVGESRNYSLMD